MTNLENVVTQYLKIERKSVVKTAKENSRIAILESEVLELENYLEVENDDDVQAELEKMKAELSELEAQSTTEKTSVEEFGLAIKYRIFLYMMHNKEVSLEGIKNLEKKEALENLNPSYAQLFFSKAELSKSVFNVVGLCGSKNQKGFLSVVNSKLEKEYGSEAPQLKKVELMKVFGRNDKGYFIKKDYKEFVGHFLKLQGYDARNFEFKVA